MLECISVAVRLRASPRPIYLDYGLRSQGREALATFVLTRAQGVFPFATAPILNGICVYHDINYEFAYEFSCLSAAALVCLKSFKFSMG